MAKSFVGDSSRCRFAIGAVGINVPDRYTNTKQQRGPYHPAEAANDLCRRAIESFVVAASQ